MTISLRNHSLPEESFAVLARALGRRFAEKGLSLAEQGFTLTLRLDPALGDRYLIEPVSGGAVLTGGDPCAVHAAAGRFLMASSFDGEGGFVPCAEAIDFTPGRPLRGMYFATHFNNYYHNAPLEKVYDVIEDLALRGCNALLVWYDMHHYQSIDQPESVTMIARLKAFLAYAKKIGMKACMTMLSNEAFDSSPEQLRADWMPQGNYHSMLDGHYHREICPSKPGGVAEILRMRRQVFEAFADVQPDYVCFWPYDQGGCTCPDCAPWGANGLLKIYPEFVKLLHEVLPGTGLIFSTWYFDLFTTGEWDAFYPHLKAGELADADYIMSFFFRGELPEVLKKEGIPEGVRFIDFPEISMYTCRPWGGFGVNVLARFLDETNQKSGHLYAGGFPYSEGIFEDINKHIILGWYSGRHKTARSAVKEWARFELCCDDDQLVDAILKTETALARENLQREHPYRFNIADTSDVEEVHRVIMAYDEKLPDPVRKSVRWRLVYLRAVCDYEIAKADGWSGRSERCQAALKELYELYYTSEKTVLALRPPVE